MLIAIKKLLSFDQPGNNDNSLASTVKLVAAINDCDLDAIKAIVRQPGFFSESYKDEEGNTPLHHISNIQDEAQRIEIATVMIERGMCIDFTNNKNEKPKHYAEFKKIQKKTEQQFLNPWANRLILNPANDPQLNFKRFMFPIFPIAATFFISPFLFSYSLLSYAAYLLLCRSYIRYDNKLKKQIYDEQDEVNTKYNENLHRKSLENIIEPTSEPQIDINFTPQPPSSNIEELSEEQFPKPILTSYLLNINSEGDLPKPEQQVTLSEDSEADCQNNEKLKGYIPNS